MVACVASHIVKKIKVDGNWKLLSIPRNAKGNYD